MTFYSYLYETYKTRGLEQKGHFLADAIRKANQERSLLSNTSHWINVALKLLDDPTVPTYYVPIRDVIKCLEKGNIDLAIKLYLNPENNEVHNRAGELLNELLDRAQGDERALSQIEETNHLLSIINFIRNIQELKKHGCSANDIKEFISHNLVERANLRGVEDVSAVEQNLDFISQHNLNTQEDILQALPHFRKIISNCRSSLLDDMVVSPKLEDKILCARFPSDIIKNKGKGINIALTLGFADESFAEPQNQNMNFAPADYDKDLRVIPMMNKTLVLKNDDSDTNEQNHAKSLDVSKKQGFMQKFFSRSFKTAVSDDVIQQESIIDAPSSFFRRGGMSMKKMHNIDEEGSNDVSIIDLYDTYSQSQNLTQLINSDKVEKDVDIFIHAAERLKSWDSLHTLAKDIDEASDIGFDQLTAKDFLDPDATVSLAGDIEVQSMSSK